VTSVLNAQRKITARRLLSFWRKTKNNRCSRTPSGVQPRRLTRLPATQPQPGCLLVSHPTNCLVRQKPGFVDPKYTSDCQEEPTIYWRRDKKQVYLQRIV